MPKQTLQILPEIFVIHSLPDNATIPAEVFKAPIYFIGKTNEELSLVVPDNVTIDSDDSDSGWKALEVLGPLNLSMVGIMSQIGGVLAEAKVSIFVLSTFETDFFLVKQDDIEVARRALTENLYKVLE